MEKYLIILARNNYYKIDKHGCIIRTDMKFSPGCQTGHEWLFIGVSKHHMSSYPTISFDAILKNPQLAIGGYLWDIDHGSTRTWRGGGNNKIQSAYLKEE